MPHIRNSTEHTSTTSVTIFPEIPPIHHPNAKKLAFNASDAPRKLDEGYAGEEHWGKDGGKDYPEGGYGWVVVAACFAMHFTFFGTVHVWGILQHAYLHGPFAGQISLTTLAIVGTLQPGIRNLFSILAGTLVSVFGFRPILLLGSAIASAGYLTASFVDYPLLLIPTQGIMVGLGGALIFTPLLAVPSHWFMRKRALVAGICVAGAGLGGLTMAAVVERLLHVVGLNWTLRILSVLLFSVGTICSFLIRPRLPSRQETIFRWSTLDGVWTLRFLYLAGTVALFYLIDFIPLFILPAYSLSLGENEEKSALVLGILNITQAIGRIASGWVGDRFGRINTLALILGASSIVCFALWLPASDYGTLMAFACIFGIFSGGVISLAVSIIPDLYGIDRTATYTGLVFGVSGVPILIGDPVSESIREHFGYDASKLFCGSGLALATLLAIALRTTFSTRWTARV